MKASGCCGKFCSGLWGSCDQAKDLGTRGPPFFQKRFGFGREISRREPFSWSGRD